MTHLLDRPAWQALNTIHSPLAVGDHRARRYADETVPFLSTGTDDAASLASLDPLVGDGRLAIILQRPAIALPETLVATVSFEGVQMTGIKPFPKLSDPSIRKLGPDDAEDMLALASLTKPGPFTLGAQKLGNFWGIRMEDRLVAMAGERMKCDGHTELSGVCTHPDFQGQGLGRLMSEFVAGEISSRGEIPFLHAYATNLRAITLYEKIGFGLRTMMNGAVVGRRDTQAHAASPH